MPRSPESSKTLTMVNLNVEKGINWRQAADWIRDQAPDILFMQEVQPGQLRRIGRRLGMKGYLAAPRPGSSNDNAIYVKKRGRVVVVAEHKQASAPWHAPANIAVKLRGADGRLSDRRISLVCWHGCYWSPEHRLSEAKWCSTLAKPGWLSIHFGDWNSYRIGEGGPWDGYEDKAYYVNRTYIDGNGERRNDDRPDREMLDAGYVEAARYAATQLGLADAMKGTAGHRNYPGRPDAPPYCIDRGYLTDELAPALVHFEVCDTPDLRDMSDHLPLVAIFDYEVLSAILGTSTEIYTPTIIRSRPARRPVWLRGRPLRRRARTGSARRTRGASPNRG